ncbi:hypothetical protein [Streptosporangium sp. OZ121]|uniref:hypothetical protein n=1 Tax=Streptosporangium sp. OZ121 TaxID=3444183 RepID=UPI003F7A4DCC
MAAGSLAAVAAGGLIRPHQENRHAGASDDVERVTGVPAQTVEAFAAARGDFHSGWAAGEPHRPRNEGIRCMYPNSWTHWMRKSERFTLR